jgi:hypothetical protein
MPSWRIILLQVTVKNINILCVAQQCFMASLGDRPTFLSNFNRISVFWTDIHKSVWKSVQWAQR